jgi:hypothetical protein
MVTKSIKIETYSNTELISLRTTVEIEMKKRNISFSVGEVGEKLAIAYFNETKGLPNLQGAPTGTKNIDAISRDGDRYSIKTRLKAKKTSTVYPDDLDPDKQLFEYILLVKIDENYQLISIHQFTWQQFVKFRSWDKRMSAWYLSCSNKSLKEGDLIT